MQKALGSAWPSERRQYPNRASKIDDYREIVDGWLRADLTAPRKQRHTAKRIFDRLREEHQAEVSYSRVRAYVSVRRGEILAESSRAPVEVFVLQSHRPAEEAEVDFGDVVIELRGQPVTCALFALRLSYSARAVHRVSLSAGQEAFLEGHEHAFSVLGGVPFGRIRYDNLKSAVSAVLGLSRHRVETSAGWRFAPTTVLRLSTASPASREPMRRAELRARSAGFATIISCRSRRSSRSPNSTR